MRRRRQRGQAIVEFGLIALMFTALLFAVVDLGLLLNTWLSVSNGTREIARAISVGKDRDFLFKQTGELVAGSVTTKGFNGGACCSDDSAVELKVTYFNKCIPHPTACTPVDPFTVANTYPGGSCGTGTCAHPAPGDYVRVEVFAHGAQVITPLIRPVFGCRDGSNPQCLITLSSRNIVRFEGQDF